MDFTLTSEQESFKKMARDFTEKEIIPVSRELDENEEFPSAILKKMDEVGLFNLSIPEKYGGPGVDALSYSIIFEEIARGCAGVATCANGNALSLYPLLLGGTEGKKGFLQICEGSVWLLCEGENAGSDASALARVKTVITIISGSSVYCNAR